MDAERTSEWVFTTISRVRLPRNKHTKRISIIERERSQNATVSMGELVNFQLCRGRSASSFPYEKKNSSRCAHNFCPRICIIFVRVVFFFFCKRHFLQMFTLLCYAFFSCTAHILSRNLFIFLDFYCLCCILYVSIVGWRKHRTLGAPESCHLSDDDFWLNISFLFFVASIMSAFHILRIAYINTKKMSVALFHSLGETFCDYFRFKDEKKKKKNWVNQRYGNKNETKCSKREGTNGKLSCFDF